MSVRKYIPPYTVSEEAVNLIAEISAAVERYDIAISGGDGLRHPKDKPHQDDSRIDCH